MNCFWCGEEVKGHSVEYEVGGEKKTFHRGMFKDCLNEFLKWQQSRAEVASLQLLRIAKAARIIH